MREPAEIREKRPWGLFRQYAKNARCTVKIIEVMPGQELSLQVHRKRDELWVALDGGGTVRIGVKKIKAAKNRVYFVRRGQPHRISAGKKMARFLEISFGKFSEKDELRLKDRYGRD